MLKSVESESSSVPYNQALSRMYRQGKKRYICKKRYMKLLKRGEYVEREGNKYFWHMKPKINIYYLETKVFDIACIKDTGETVYVDIEGHILNDDLECSVCKAELENKKVKNENSF